jgi:hypothetical protein
MLEKTHKQLIQLPSIAQEINNKKLQTEMTDTYSETDIDNYDSSDFNSIKDMTENIIRDKFFELQNKLNKMEKKYDEIIPILDKLLTKITHLNDDIKEIKNNKIESEQKIFANNVEKSSLVMTSKNENIKIHIQETEQLEEEDISDDEDVNPLLITCSTISLKEEEKPPSIDIKEEDDDEELSVEQELGIEEVLVEEKKVEVKGSDEKENVEEVPVEEKKVEVKGSDEKENVEEDEEDASVETETKEEVEEDASVETETNEEDEDIFEIEIDDKTYCTNNDENGFIWELNEEGEQGDKVGYLKVGCIICMLWFCVRFELFFFS